MRDQGQGMSCVALLPVAVQTPPGYVAITTRSLLNVSNHRRAYPANSNLKRA